jgi:hypothetical protein
MTKRLAILLAVLVGLLIGLFFQRAPPWTVYRLERRVGKVTRWTPVGLIWRLDRHVKTLASQKPVDLTGPLSVADLRAIRHAARAWVWQQFWIRVTQRHFRDGCYLLALALRPSPPVQGFDPKNALVFLCRDYHVGVTKNAGRWAVDMLQLSKRLDDGGTMTMVTPTANFAGTNAAPMPYHLKDFRLKGSPKLIRIGPPPVQRAAP